MKTLEVTDEQYAQLDAVREALAEDVTYGHVRPRDAVQFLLDAHDDEDLDVSVDASSGTDADDIAAEANETADTDAADGTDAADDGSEDESAEPNDAADGDGDDAGGAPTPTPTPGGGGDRMSAMMNLLDTHDEKWERADSQETRYVVDLPDGTTEEVQTKDDVKAILFKNY